MSNRRGFTLIELMIVVVIIGILAALATPKFQVAAYRAKEKEAESILKQVYTMQNAHRAQSGGLAPDVAALQALGFERPSRLEYYTWDDNVSVSPFCLAAAPGGASHSDRCIDLDTGDIGGR